MIEGGSRKPGLSVHCPTKASQTLEGGKKFLHIKSLGTLHNFAGVQCLLDGMPNGTDITVLASKPNAVQYLNQNALQNYYKTTMMILTIKVQT